MNKKRSARDVPTKHGRITVSPSATNRKRKPAGETYVKANILLSTNFLPDALDDAIRHMARSMANSREWKADDAREFAHNTLKMIWLALLNEALIQSRDLGRGAKGPRLPPNVTFADLLPHLREAQCIMDSGGRLEDWLASKHTWPGDIKPKGATVRTWLLRYAKWIKAYDEGMKGDDNANSSS
jgi:hypothetical protein